MDRLERGYVQIYTGDGKGKTTAAIGQAIRSVGNGLKVYMLQFLKTGETGELEIAKVLGEKFQIFRFQTQEGFFWNLNDKEKAIVQTQVNKSYDFAIEVIKNNRCDVFILDEIISLISY